MCEYLSAVNVFPVPGPLWSHQYLTTVPESTRQILPVQEDNQSISFPAHQIRALLRSNLICYQSGNQDFSVIIYNQGFKSLFVPFYRRNTADFKVNCGNKLSKIKDTMRVESERYLPHFFSCILNPMSLLGSRRVNAPPGGISEAIASGPRSSRFRVL